MYDGAGGDFSADRPTVLGTDGERLLIGTREEIAAYGAADDSPLWQIPIDLYVNQRTVGNKVYDQNRRIL